MRTRPSFRATYALKVTHLAGWVTALAAVTVIPTALATHTLAERPAVTDSPSAVLGQHSDECWRGSQPALAELPGHVIWQHPSGHTVYSSRLVGPALEATFGNGGLPGRPIAFCI